MAITPIAPPTITPIKPVVPSAAGAGTAPAGVGSVSGSFGSMLSDVAGSLESADQLSKQLASGQLTNIHDLTAAAAKAELGVQLTVAFRDRAVDAFQQIMNMQV